MVAYIRVAVGAVIVLPWPLANKGDEVLSHELEVWFTIGIINQCSSGKWFGNIPVQTGLGFYANCNGRYKPSGWRLTSQRCLPCHVINHPGDNPHKNAPTLTRATLDSMLFLLLDFKSYKNNSLNKAVTTSPFFDAYSQQPPDHCISVTHTHTNTQTHTHTYAWMHPLGLMVRQFIYQHHHSLFRVSVLFRLRARLRSCRGLMRAAH